MRTIIGIDNGVTGAITVVSDWTLAHVKTPVRKELSYTKKQQWITRVEVVELRVWLRRSLRESSPSFGKLERPFVLMERPMIMPGRFKATMSALRCLEATLIVLEELHLPVQYIDSKEWQKVLLPKGLKKGESKKAAESVAKRLFPDIKRVNADSLLIAEYGRRTYK